MRELEPGDYVTPTVRLLRPLAAGGMGTVWLAEHLVLETNVVVKLMTPAIAGNAAGAARFAREAAIAAAVKSPHVVQVFDSGMTEDGVAFIVMELLDGHDLGAHLTAYGPMTPVELAPVVTQLAKALAKAHRVGIVHRDLKPENVFLCDVEGGEPFVKLLDFGTAKDEQRAPFATTTGELIGTPYYMSPEQILGEAVDARTDVWSLGVLAFEALTGARPFEGATVGAITLAIHTTSPRLTDVVPDLPVALDDWFDRACAREPSERFQSAKAAGDAFAHAATGAESNVDSSSDAIGEWPAAAEPLPLVPRTAKGSARPPRTAMASERIATSLSSTLSAPRHERRTMTWIASGVVAASVLGMIGFFAYDDQVPTVTTVAPSSTTFTSSASASAIRPAVSPPPPAPPSPPPVTSPARSSSVPSPSAAATASSMPPVVSALLAPPPAPSPAARRSSATPSATPSLAPFPGTSPFPRDPQPAAPSPSPPLSPSPPPSLSPPLPPAATKPDPDPDPPLPVLPTPPAPVDRDLFPDRR